MPNIKYALIFQDATRLLNLNRAFRAIFFAMLVDSSRSEAPFENPFPGTFAMLKYVQSKLDILYYESNLKRKKHMVDFAYDNYV